MLSKLTVQQAYGLNAYSKNTVSCLDDNHNIIYACGNQVIVLNIETKEQVFINLTPNNSNNTSINNIPSNQLQPTSQGISAIAISPQKKFIAIAEKSEVSLPAYVSFYDLITYKRKRILNFPDLISNEICCMDFCQDGHLFITQSKFPEWSLTLWSIEKTCRILSNQRITTSEDSMINQIAFCPYDSNIILIIGKSILKLFRIVEGQLRPMTLNVKRESANMTSYCWINAEVLILGSETGEIFLIENLEYRGIIFPEPTSSASLFSSSIYGHSGTAAGGVSRMGTTHTPTTGMSGTNGENMSRLGINSSGTSNNTSAKNGLNNNENERPMPVYSLVATSKGGFISGHSNGEIILFERHSNTTSHNSHINNTNNNNNNNGQRDIYSASSSSSSSSMFQIEKKIQLTNKKGCIHSLHILNDDNLIISTDTHQLFNFSLSSLDQVKENQIFEPLLTHFHEPNDKGDASIISIGTSLWKPHTAFTCGKDNTLKIWNIDDKKLEMSKDLSDEPLLMSIHQNGMIIAIAFESKIKMYSILKDDLYIINQLPVRSSTCLSYSNGGQFLGTASGSTIHIFDSLTGAPVCSLRGHTNRIKNIIWQDFDATLMSFGYEGSIYFWELFPPTKIPELQHVSSVSTVAGVGYKDGSYAFCCNVDKQLKKVMFNSNITMSIGTIGVGAVAASGNSNANTNIITTTSNNNNAVVMNTMTKSGTSLTGTTSAASLSQHPLALAAAGGIIDLKRDASVMLLDEYRGVVIVGTHGTTSSNNDIFSTIHSSTTATAAAACGSGGGNNQVSKTTAGVLLRIPVNFDTYAAALSNGNNNTTTAMTNTNSLIDVSSFHSSTITALCMSIDGSMLFSGDENGCLIISSFENNNSTNIDVKHKIVSNSNDTATAMSSLNNNSTMMTNTITATNGNKNNIQHNNSKNHNNNNNSNTNNPTTTGMMNTTMNKLAIMNDNNAQYQFVDEIMVHDAKIDETLQEVQQLNTEITNVSYTNSSAIHTKSIDYEKSINQMLDRFANQLHDENEQYQVIVNDKAKLTKAFYDEYFSFSIIQADELKAINKKYQYKLTIENNRLQVLIKEMENSEKKWKDESSSLISSHEAYISDITEENESLLQDEADTNKSHQSDKLKLQNSAKERGLLIKSNVDNEISQIKVHFDNKVKVEEAVIAELMTKHATIKKELSAITAELQLHREDVVRMKEKETRLIENNKVLEKDIQTQKKEIRDREDMLGDKDKRMADLKKKNQELEKFRFVLDYKIKELKLQIAPSEQEIFIMRKQLEEMKMELTSYHKSSKALTVMINELKLKIDGIKHEIDNEERKLHGNNILIQRMYRDVKHLSDLIDQDDMNVLKPCMVTLFRDYVQSTATLSSSSSSSSSNNISSGTSGSSGGGSARETMKMLATTDPEQIYNRDREQIERNIDSLTRLVKTGSGAYKRDIRRKKQDQTELLQELDTLRQDTKAIQKQKQYIDEMIKLNGGEKLHPHDLHQLLVLFGYEKKTAQEIENEQNNTSSSSSSSSFSLPIITNGNPIQRNLNEKKKIVTVDQKWSQAWEAVENQSDVMIECEEEIESLCKILQLDASRLIQRVDSKLVMS